MLMVGSMWVCTLRAFHSFRVRQASAEGIQVIDVDGTYLEQKRQKLLPQNPGLEVLPCPDFPVVGWLVITLGDHP